MPYPQLKLIYGRESKAPFLSSYSISDPWPLTCLLRLNSLSSCNFYFVLSDHSKALPSDQSILFLIAFSQNCSSEALSQFNIVKELLHVGFTDIPTYLSQWLFFCATLTLQSIRSPIFFFSPEQVLSVNHWSYIQINCLGCYSMISKIILNCNSNSFLHFLSTALVLLSDFTDIFSSQWPKSLLQIPIISLGNLNL